MREYAVARFDFALHSPDFWRGIVIAFAVLTGVFVVKLLVNAIVSPSPVPSSGSKIGQVCGLLSYLLLVIVAAGHQASRLGEVTWSWRLVLSFAALCFGTVWAVEMTSFPNRVREWLQRRK